MPTAVQPARDMFHISIRCYCLTLGIQPPRSLCKIPIMVGRVQWIYWVYIPLIYPIVSYLWICLIVIATLWIPINNKPLPGVYFTSAGVTNRWPVLTVSSMSALCVNAHMTHWVLQNWLKNMAGWLDLHLHWQCNVKITECNEFKTTGFLRHLDILGIKIHYFSQNYCILFQSHLIWYLGYIIHEFYIS